MLWLVTCLVAIWLLLVLLHISTGLIHLILVVALLLFILDVIDSHRPRA